MPVRPPHVHGVDDLEHHSDVEFLALEEIRFLAAITMSLRPDHGTIYVYPLPAHWVVIDGSDEEFVERALRECALMRDKTFPAG